MPNLFEYTLSTLREYDRSPKDVLFCQLNDSWFSWSDFRDLSDIEFNRIGGLVNPDLMILGRDFIMQWSVDGDDQEWWFIDHRPQKPPKRNKPVSLKLE